MGSFDSVHTGNRCGQTKAFGKGYRDLVPGDEVVLRPATRSASDVEDSPGSFVMPPVDLSDFQVAAFGGGFLVVRSNRLVAWVDDLDPSLPVRDNLGHPAPHVPNPAPAPSKGPDPAEDLLEQLFGPSSAEERSLRAAESDQRLRALPGDCSLCASLRSPRA